MGRMTSSRAPGRARTRPATSRSAPSARAVTTTRRQRSRIAGPSWSTIRSSAWSIAMLRADMAVSLRCPVTAMRRSRGMLPSSMPGTLPRGAWSVGSITSHPARSAASCEVGPALSRSELAGYALVGNMLDHRRGRVSELGIPDLYATGSLVVDDGNYALAVEAEPGGADGPSTGGRQHRQLLAAGSVEHQSGAIFAGNHDLAAIRVRRCRVGGRAGLE